MKKTRRNPSRIFRRMSDYCTKHFRPIFFERLLLGEAPLTLALAHKCCARLFVVLPTAQLHTVHTHETRPLFFFVFFCRVRSLAVANPGRDDCPNCPLQRRRMRISSIRPWVISRTKTSSSYTSPATLPPWGSARSCAARLPTPCC